MASIRFWCAGAALLCNGLVNAEELVIGRANVDNDRGWMVILCAFVGDETDLVIGIGPGTPLPQAGPAAILLLPGVR